MCMNISVSVGRGCQSGVIFKEFNKVVIAFKRGHLRNLTDCIKGCGEQSARIFQPLLINICFQQDAVGVFKNSAYMIFVITEMFGNRLRR